MSALLATSVAAQSFHVDLVPTGTSTPTLPPATYGGAALQPGVWTSAHSLDPWSSGPLVDVDGVTRDVRVDFTGTTNSEYVLDDPAWSGGDAALMEDGASYGNGGFGQWVVAGLLPGRYDVFVHVCSGSTPVNAEARVSFGWSQGSPQLVAGAWSGSPHVENVSYAHGALMIGAGDLLPFQVDDTPTFTDDVARVTGFQLVHRAPVGTPFCSGVASACPCGNGGAGGCRNSIGASGVLRAFGTASLARDSVLLTLAGSTGGSVLLFQGTARVAGGAGAVFGDGLRCAGGVVTRLALLASATDFPPHGTAGVAQRGGVTQPGTRTYQAWYRDAGAFCTPATFNLTNGVEISWTQ